jgi:uncharacterized protein YndB with AHSA1/START domain
MQKSFAIEQAYYFDASPERVFKALTDSKALAKWFLSKAKLDPKKGGQYTFDWIGGYHMAGKVKNFEANSAVSLSWHDKMRNGEMANTTASFKVARKGKGTLLKLRHGGFKDPEHFADCSSRWGYYLTNMKSVLDHRVDLRSKYDW